MPMHRAIIVSAMLLTVALTSAPTVAQRRAGEMDDREVVKLAESLSSAGMTELLEALVENRQDLRDTPAGWALQAELRIGRANRITSGDAERQSRRTELLSEAAELLGRAADATARATSDSGKIEHFRYRLKRIDVLSTQLPRPELVRLMYLRGGERDRRRAIQQTEQTVNMMESCLLDLEDTLQQWRQDLVKIATVLPELESVYHSAMYQAGWVRFYRGMVLPPQEGDRHQRLLADAIDIVRRFAQRRRDNGAKQRSMLLAGMAAREMGEYEQAREYLNVADDRSAAPAVRIQAKFQKARSAVESADSPDQGNAAIETFRRELGDLLGEGSAIQADLHATMLREHLFRKLARSARRQGDEDRAGEYAEQADLALLAFMETHGDPAVQRALLEILAHKHAGSQADDSPVLMLAKASQAADEEAQKLLEELLRREGTVAERLRPLAMWRLGLLHSRNGLHRKSAGQFLRLAREYPDHRLALDAARNAAALFRRIMTDMEDSGEAPGTALRREFIDVLRVVTEGWPEQTEAARWNFELGWQLQQLADGTDEPVETMTRAVAAYENVPADVDESTEARFLALRLRVEILRDFDLSDNEKRQSADALVKELRAYANRVAEMLAADGDRNGDLARWGAEADFQAARLEYEVLGRTEAAIGGIRELPQKWPDGETLRAAAEFEIRKLVETGRIGVAIDRVERFRREYPDEARQLILLVAWEVRGRLRELTEQSDAAQRHGNLAESFLVFASDLYSRSQDRPDRQRYPYMRMYAEALLVNGRAAEALELFQRCRELDEQMRAEDPDLPIDAANIRGLAAANQSLGNHDRAAKLYGDLVAGMEPSDALYWRTELEYARSLLEARRDSPDAMRRLRLRIRQLRGEDRRMGGLYAGFDEVEAAAVGAMRR